MSESDGIEDALQGVIRMAVMTGSQVGAQIARQREQQLRNRQLQDERTAQLLAERFAAERRVAEVQLAQIHRDDWWDTADPEKIGQLTATAAAWQSHSTEADRAAEKIREEVLRRYHVDLRGGVSTDSAATTAAVRRGEQNQRRRSTQQEEHAGERAEASILLQATAHDAPQPSLAAEPDQMEAPLPGYDTAERRAATAADMQQAGVERPVIQSRVQADTGFGAPATKATAPAGKSRSPKARISRIRGRGDQLTLPGVER